MILWSALMWRACLPMSQLMMYFSYGWKDYSLIRHWKIGQLWILCHLTEPPTLPSREKYTNRKAQLWALHCLQWLAAYSRILRPQHWLLQIIPQPTVCGWHLCRGDKLETFLSHINSLHDNILFTMGRLLFGMYGSVEITVIVWKHQYTISPHTWINT